MKRAPWISAFPLLSVLVAASAVAAVPAKPDLAKGQTIASQLCAACHGATGRGDGPLARTLTSPPVDLTRHVEYHPESQILLWIKNGMRATPMPAFAGRYSDEEIWEIVNYLRRAFVVVDQ